MAGLQQFLDPFGGSEQSAIIGNSTSAGNSQDLSTASVATDHKQDKPRTDVKLSHLASGNDSNMNFQTTETILAGLLDSTLWNRRLAPSERIVYAFIQHKWQTEIELKRVQKLKEKFRYTHEQLILQQAEFG